MTKLLSYLKQPTTWAGLTGIASAFGVNFAPELTAEIVTAGTAIAGLLLVIFNEDKNAD